MAKSTSPTPCACHVRLSDLGGGKFSACLGIEGHAEVQAEAPELGWIERHTDDSSTTTAGLIFTLLGAGLPVGVSERQKVTVDHHGLDLVVLLRGVPALSDIDFLHQGTVEEETEKFTFSIRGDTSVIEQQVREAKALSRSSELFADEIKRYLGEMSDDIVIGKPVAAVTADGANELVFTPRLGAKFERIIAAFRASQPIGLVNHNTLN